MLLGAVCLSRDPCCSVRNMGAAADCEAIGQGLLRQPINSITTFALMGAGIWLIIRGDRRWIGVALIATGFGSFLFHGPMSPGAEWAHDVTLGWLLLVVAGSDTKWEVRTRVPGLLALAALFAVFPAAADPIAVTIAFIAVVVRVRLDRSSQTLRALALTHPVEASGRRGGQGQTRVKLARAILTLSNADELLNRSPGRITPPRHRCAG